VNLVLVGAGVLLVLLPGLAEGASRQIRPAEWARLAVTATWLGLRSIQIGLLLTASPTVLRAAGVESAADTCHELFGPIVPRPALAWISAAAFVALTAGTRAKRSRARREQRRAHIESWLGHHEIVDGTEVVVLPTDRILAYAAPGRPPQVVVSEGLTQTLADDEMSAVIRHEQAHLRHHHNRHLVLASAVAGTLGWLPGVHRSMKALRLSLERWADEAAADRPGARDQVRRALLKTTETLVQAVPAFTDACTIIERLEALRTPPPDPSTRQRAAVAGPVLALTIVVGACLVGWTIYAHHAAIGLLGTCPLD
jgi:bla regulator protein blaR1